MPMELVNGVWTNTGTQTTPSQGYFAGNTGVPAASTQQFWSQFEVGPSEPQQPQATNTNPLMAAFAPQGSTGNTGGAFSGPVNLDTLTQYYAQAGPADGNPAYWAQQSLEKILKGANVQDTLNYMTGRDDFKTLGGFGPSAGGMGGFSPLAPFQYGGNFSTFNAPQVAAPANFSYTGPAVPNAPTALNFPGVYSQPQAAPQQTAAAQPATNPHGTDVGNGMVKLSNGATVPTNHPLAAEYNAWQPPAPAEAQPIAPPAEAMPLVPPGSAVGSSTTGPGGAGVFTPPSQAAMPGPFQFNQNVPTPYQASGEFSYGQPVPQGYQAQNFAYQGPGVPQTYQPESFSYGQPLPQAYQAQNFSYGQALPEGYAPGEFTATTAADVLADPSYLFRDQRQRDAIEQSAAARGNLNSTGTLKSLADYSGQLASQEFGNVDARRRATYAQTEAGKLAAAQQAQSLQGQGFGQALGTAGFNADQQQAAAASAQGLQQQGFGQAATTAGINAGNQQTAAAQALAAQGQGFGQQATAAQINAGNQQAAGAQALAGQQQGYQQALGSAAFNEANQQAAAQSAQQAQAQGYGQASNTYNTNYQNLFNQNQANFGNALAGFGANQGAQNQAFGQAVTQAQLNANIPLQYQQQAWQQQYTPWAQGASNSLQAGIANASNANATNALNAGQEWNQFQSQWLPYQSQVDQHQFGAGMGLNWANYGLNANNQAFNQNLAGYNTNYQTQVVDPWNQQMQLANLGLGAANGLGGFGQNYASNLGNLYTGLGNAQAGAGIASGNAWQGALGNVAQLPTYLYGMSQMYPQGNATGTVPNNGVLP